jgi:hypothetical protein
MLEATRNRRQTVLLGVVLTIALSGLIAAGFGGRIGLLLTESENRDTTPQAHRPETKRADLRSTSMIYAQPPAGAPFELVRTLISGGGGDSAGGAFQLTGSAGQAAAGTLMTG